MVVLSSFVYPDSPIRYEQRNTRAVLDKNDLGLGTLYISEKSVGWKEHGDAEKGFCLSYHHISLHATCTDPNVYPRECIYIMIDKHVVVPGTSVSLNGDKSDSDAESDDEDMSELILVPGDPGAMDPMYEALKECQALNPDPVDMESDDDDDVYEDADENVQSRAFIQNDIGDIGGGGDTVMDNLSQHLQTSVTVRYDYSNGDPNDEDFEDAD